MEPTNNRPQTSRWMIYGGIGFAIVLLLGSILVFLGTADNASFEDFARTVSSLPQGQVRLDTPDELNRDDTATVRLVVSLGVETESELNTKVSDVMQALLVGEEFEIGSLQPDSQGVLLDAETVWEWTITPKSTGSHSLDASLIATPSVGEERIARRVWDERHLVEVNATWLQISQGFAASNWQWLWAVLLVPFVGWLFRRWRNRDQDPVSVDSSDEGYV